MKRFVLFLVLSAPSWLWATEFVVPKQTIVGAEEPIPAGELVDLSPSPIKDKPEHLEQSSYEWVVLDNGKEKRVKTSKDGVFFGAGVEKKNLFVLCVATYVYVVRDGDKVKEVAVRTAKLTTIVQVAGGVVPPAPPGPTPPGPDVPDGKYQLTSFVYKEAVAKVAGPDKEKQAKALAGSFRAVAAAIGAGSLTKDADILKQTAQKNQDALGSPEAIKAWQGFSVSLQEKLFSLYQSGTLRGKDTFAEAWLAIADGLDKVK